MSVLRFEADKVNFVELGDRSFFVHGSGTPEPRLLSAQCPHRGGPLFLGTLVESPRESIRCPWHGTLVAVAKAACLAPPMVVNRGRYTVVAKETPVEDIQMRRVQVLTDAAKPSIGAVAANRPMRARLRRPDAPAASRGPRPTERRRLRAGHLLSIEDLDPEELAHLIDLGQSVAEGRESFTNALAGKRIGLYFRNPSSRTRTSMFAAIERMGGRSIDYKHGDLQLDNGESLEDTALALELYLDALVVRTNGPQAELTQLARASRDMAIVNALTKEEHPTQAIADLITIKQEFGELAGRHVLYVGASNNTSSSLLLACSKIRDLAVTLATPEASSPDPAIVEIARANAAKSGGRVECLHGVEAFPEAVDVIYTARWQSMGVEPADSAWRSELDPRRVTREFMRRVGNENCIFMHDLPASRGDEVTSEVLDASYSRIRRQAANKAVAAMVTLKQLVGN